MKQIQERQLTTVRTLIETMRSYMNDQTHSRDVNERWLADYLIPVWKTVCEVGNRNLSEGNAAASLAFRAAELQAEIDAKKKETQKLETGLKKLKAA